MGGVGTGERWRGISEKSGRHTQHGIHAKHWCRSLHFVPLDVIACRLLVRGIVDHRPEGTQGSTEYGMHLVAVRMQDHRTVAVRAASRCLPTGRCPPSLLGCRILAPTCTWDGPSLEADGWSRGSMKGYQG